MTKATKSQDAVSSVMKVFGILQAISETPEIGITELSQRIMMPKSTVYRFIQTMKSLGYITQDGDNDKYSLTFKLFEIGSRVLQHVDLIKVADVKMRELSKLTKETTHLGIRDNDSIVYVHKIDSEYNLRMHSRIGRHNPLYSTAIGKVLLAWLPESETREILKNVEFKAHTQHTLTSIDAILNELAQVRQQGYSWDNEEMEEGLLCIGKPVYDRFGQVVAGLSLSFPMSRCDEDRKLQYIQHVTKYANDISALIGGGQFAI